MKILGRVFVGLVFMVLILIFILLITLRFGFLNSKFMFWSLERHGVYEQTSSFLETALNQKNLNIDNEEKTAYKTIVKKVTPSLAKEIFERNASQVIDYLNGETSDATLSVPLDTLGIPGAKTNFELSLSHLPDPKLSESVSLAHGIGRIIVYVSAAVLFLLLGTFYVFSKFFSDHKKGWGLIIGGGVFMLILGLIGKGYILVLMNTLPQGSEPAAKLLAIVAGSICTDITTAWLTIGAILIVGGIMFPRFMKQKSTSRLMHKSFRG